MTDQPIEVSENAIGTQVLSAIRSLLTAGIGWGVGKGYFDAATGGQLVSALLILIPIAWSQTSAYLKHRNLVRVAAVVPDSVAQVK